MLFRVGTLALIALLVAGCASAGPSWSFGAPLTSPTPVAAGSPSVARAPSAAPSADAPSAAPASTPEPSAAPAPTPEPSAAPAPTPPLTAEAVSHDTATLSEFRIALASPTLAAGTDTFSVTNAGTIAHEFVIKRSTVSDAALPTKADGTVDEESAELGDVGEVEIATPGTTKDLAEDLAPGTYVFFCNIPGHYAGGMHGSFTVVATAAAAP
jgi:uncharacterized cupredoxin-like copper-binding protein